MPADGGIVRREVGRVERLQGVRHVAVEQLASRQGELTIGDLANAGVGEIEPPARLVQHATAKKLLQAFSSLRRCESGGALQEIAFELASNHGCARGESSSPLGQPLQTA